MNNIKYRYFKFYEGRYFRLDEENYDFQILKDDMWQDEELMSIFIDNIRDYYEIKDENTILMLKSFKEETEKHK